ncbi:MAG: eCIS core domain-containing protein [Pseudonocardiaceae bacterium]
MSKRLAGVASRTNSDNRAEAIVPKEFQRDAEPSSLKRFARPNAWPAWVQRCGIGSSCDCRPNDKLAGIQHDLQRSAAHGGSLLPFGTRAHQERAFAYDFSAAPIQRHAVASGTNTLSRSGDHRPGMPADDRLLAHELAHTVSQAGTIHRAPLDDHSAAMIGPADDEYERQANAVAASVVHGMSVDGVGGSGTLNTLGSDHAVQRLCSSCRAGQGCPDNHDGENEGCVASDRSSGNNLLQTLVGSPPAGAPVPKRVRSMVEPVLGSDLSGVQVHSDPTSHRVAGDIGAKAFTHRNHVFLGAGQSSLDVSLMAHELTHTVQQGASPTLATSNVRRVQRWPSLDDVVDFVEGAAESADEAVTSAAEAVGDAVGAAGEALGDAAEAVYETASDVGEAVYDFGAGAVEAAGDAIDWLATEAGEALSAIADVLGGLISITDEGLVLTVPTICLEDPFLFSFPLPSISQEVMAPIGGLPLGPVVLFGEIGLVGRFEPAAELQLGPFCLRGVRVVVNPLTASYSISGSLTAAAAASLGAEVRGGLRGDLSLYGVVIIDGVPVPISVPIIGLEGGLAGLFRAIAAGQLTIGSGLSFGLGGISLTQGGQLDLGFGADMFLGAYGQLDIRGHNVCRIYWQPFEWHGDIGGSFGCGISLSMVPGGGPLISPTISSPVLTGLPFDQLPLALSREGFADVCPIKDAICEVLFMLNLLPSQNGGNWSWSGGPYGPGPRLPGPLACYRKNPGIRSRSECRGACGPNCDTCTSSPTYTFTDPLTGDVWEYLNFQDCNSNAGCREHDAAFDWAADKYDETGRWAIIMPWHMAANIECGCNNLAGNCIAWVAGLPPYDSKMYFADSARLVAPGGGGGSLTNDCPAEFPNAPECLASFPDRDSVLADWGLLNGITNFRDCRVTEDFLAASMFACEGAPGRVWSCTATDLGSGHDLTISVIECICCNADGTSSSEWLSPSVVIDGGMSEELILDLCERGLIPRVICIPIEEDMIARFGNRRRDLELDPDEDPETVLRPDDAPIFASFRRMYNRLDSWSIFIRTNHPDLLPEFDAKFRLEDSRKNWLKTLKERTARFKDQFRDLRNTDPERARQEYQKAVLDGIQNEIEAQVRSIAEWFRERTGSTESVDEIIERVHAEGTELWREAWRRAILQVNRVLARLWPPAKTQILIWVGQQRSRRPDLDLSGTVGKLDYIGSLATGFKGPPKQQIRFNPQKFDVDANLNAPPLAKYAIAVDGQTPDRQRIFGRNTTIVPLNQFSDQAHTELQARATGYDSTDPFDVAIDTPELPTQTRERVATERLFRLRESIGTARYQQMLDEISARGFLTAEGRIRDNLTQADFDELQAIMDRFDTTAPTPSGSRSR